MCKKKSQNLYIDSGMLPVRCFTCNAAIDTHAFDGFERARREGIQPLNKVLDDLRVRRICCRRMFLGHVNTFDDIMHYSRVDTRFSSENISLERHVRHKRRVSCD